MIWYIGKTIDIIIIIINLYKKVFQYVLSINAKEYSKVIKMYSNWFEIEILVSNRDENRLVN